MLSLPFQITNGTRQGCPLLPIIFNLHMEPMEHICSNPLISGFIIGKESHKIGLFTDDIVLMLNKPNSSLNEVYKMLQGFSRVSYYKVNESKSTILNLHLDGTTRSILQQPYLFTWAETVIPYLGIKLTKSVKGLFQVNYSLPH